MSEGDPKEISQSSSGAGKVKKKREQEGEKSERTEGQGRSPACLRSVPPSEIDFLRL